MIKENIIIDHFLQKWHSTVTSSPSLTMFLKYQLSYESCLHQLSVKNSELLAQLKLSSCKPNAISGKYENNDSNKLYKIFDLNDIEDECHFVLVCPKYLI